MLLAYSRALPGGPRVRLRLIRPRDADQLAALLERAGRRVDAFELKRLTRFDPRCRLVICATAFSDGHELLVGVGEIELMAELPEFVVADEQRCPGLEDLLREALHQRRESALRLRAA
jgi:hypothetical protein